MFNIAEVVCNARYSDILQSVLVGLSAVQVLRVSFESDYQGFVDVDILLEDGRVFSYKYYYGSCEGCDDWENRNLLDTEIADEMLQEATFFDNIDQYNKYIESIKE